MKKERLRYANWERVNETAEKCREKADRHTLEWAWNLKTKLEKWEASNPTTFGNWRDLKLNEELKKLKEWESYRGWKPEKELREWKSEEEAEKWMIIEGRLANAWHEERINRRISHGCRLLAVIVGILVLAGVDIEFGNDNNISVLGSLLVALMIIDFLSDYQKLKSRLHKDELLHAAKVAYEYIDHLSRHPETPKENKFEFLRWYNVYNPDKYAEHTWSDYAYKSCDLACYKLGESGCKRALYQHPLYPSARFTFILFVGISLVCIPRWGFLVSFFHILLMSFSIVALVGSFYHEIEYYVRNTNSVW